MLEEYQRISIPAVRRSGGERAGPCARTWSRALSLPCCAGCWTERLSRTRAGHSTGRTGRASLLTFSFRSPEGAPVRSGSDPANGSACILLKKGHPFLRTTCGRPDSRTCTLVQSPTSGSTAPLPFSVPGSISEAKLESQLQFSRGSHRVGDLPSYWVWNSVSVRVDAGEQCLHGKPKFGWFAMLKASARNSTAVFSLILKSFASAASKSINPGPCSVFRPRFPKSRRAVMQKRPD